MGASQQMMTIFSTKNLLVKQAGVSNQGVINKGVMV